MSFGDDAPDPFPIVPIYIAPNREQRDRWREAARSAGFRDFDAWVVYALERAANHGAREPCHVQRRS